MGGMCYWNEGIVGLWRGNAVTGNDSDLSWGVRAIFEQGPRSLKGGAVVWAITGAALRPIAGQASSYRYRAASRAARYL